MALSICRERSYQQESVYMSMLDTVFPDVCTVLAAVWYPDVLSLSSFVRQNTPKLRLCETLMLIAARYYASIGRKPTMVAQPWAIVHRNTNHRIWCKRGLQTGSLLFDWQAGAPHPTFVARGGCELALRNSPREPIRRISHDGRVTHVYLMYNPWKWPSASD